jgi:hypothetical protein
MEYNGDEYLTTKEAAVFCGLSTTGLYTKLDRFNEKHPEEKIIKYSFGDSRKKYIKKVDLERLMKPTPVGE